MDIVDDEVVEKVVKEVRRINPFLIAGGSFLIGAGVGYILGKKFGAPKFEVHTVPKQDFDSVVANHWEAAGLTKEDYEALRERAIESEGDDPDARMYVEMHREEVIQVSAPADLGQDMIIHSQFEDGTEDIWSYEEELQHRSEDRPYALSSAEFRDDEKDYSQVTLTYYEGDRTLTDESDEIVPNHQMVIGPLLFGHGSGDPNVFYVRNDRLKAEYEILRHPGKYEVELAGLQEENEQARQFVRDVKRQRNQQRFRPDDDDDG